jgi:hypothetical protein
MVGKGWGRAGFFSGSSDLLVGGEFFEVSGMEYRIAD